MDIMIVDYVVTVEYGRQWGYAKETGLKATYCTWYFNFFFV
jgi:hypothetical protein